MLKLFLIILYLVCPFVLSAQSLMHVRYYSAKDGLSQNTVADFLQDDKGYIWMATGMDWRSLTAIHFRTISHILRTILALNTIVFSKL
ncbi:hypothetical protein NXV73_03220 [Bacteroides salyersiae]|nr:hypothetical protein [Bacteroides salyersiae]